MAWLSFLILAMAFVYTAVGGARDWRRLTATDSADTRQHYYKKWVIDTWLALGLGAIAATWALGKINLLLKPLPHADLHVNLTNITSRESGTAAGFYVGLSVGLVTTIAVLVLRFRRSAMKAGPTVGGTNALIYSSACTTTIRVSKASWPRRSSDSF